MNKSRVWSVLRWFLAFWSVGVLVAKFVEGYVDAAVQIDSIVVAALAGAIAVTVRSAWRSRRQRGASVVLDHGDTSTLVFPPPGLGSARRLK